ncbi:MAG: energy transducer TonB [Acidobacteriota bacterium]|nr:energy transducer TonB [Acidobacteriota bacterium]
MFEKLIESDSQGAEFKNRSRYFMVSSVVVGILFVTAVVFSLYAQDLDLGSRDFELSILLAPTEVEVPEPEQPEQIQPNRTSENRSQLPSRQANIARIDDAQSVPTQTSVLPNTLRERPIGRFIITRGPESNGHGTSGTGRAGSGIPDGTSSFVSDKSVVPSTTIPDPPPAIKVVLPMKRIKSEGVINGKATYLPPPPYPVPAKLVNADGAVNVQVTIDETGKVISSKAVTGHPLLRAAAEKAAWNAKFSPTYLSKVAVKVTGIIVYNFKR